MIKKISEDIKLALKSKDKERLLVLRSLKSALKNKEIELMKELSEEQSINIIQSQVKMREQAIELFLQGDRKDLAALRSKEIEIIKEYLPTPLSEKELEEEVTAMIKECNAASMKDMGMVMKALKEKLQSRADGKTLSNLVRTKLS